MCAAYHSQFASDNFSYTEYLKRRLIRVFPFHWAMLALFILLTILTDSFDLPTSLASLFATQSWMQEFSHGTNVPSWALGPIIFFYLLFPLLFVFQKRSKFSFLIFTLALLSIVFLWDLLQSQKPDGDFPSEFYYWSSRLFPPVRLAEFCVGMILWQFYTYLKEKNFRFKSTSLIEIAICILWIGIAIFSPYVAQRWQTTLLWIIPTSMIILIFALHNDNPGIISRALSWRPIVYFGNISMAFYLSHYFCLIISRYIIARSLFRGDPDHHWFLINILAALLSIIFAIAGTHLFDQPVSRYLKRRYCLQRPQNA